MCAVHFWWVWSFFDVTRDLYNNFCIGIFVGWLISHVLSKLISFTKDLSILEYSLITLMTGGTYSCFYIILNKDKRINLTVYNTSFSRNESQTFWKSSVKILNYILGCGGSWGCDQTKQNVLKISALIVSNRLFMIIGHWR